MKILLKNFIFFCFVIIILNNGICNGKVLDSKQPKSSIIKDSIVLNENPFYAVSWEADVSTGLIEFLVTAETKGFVGFGLSNTGGMKGADIIIGGVDANGKPYFTDRHAEGTTLPIIDEQQDWELINATENSTYTILNFKRKLDTCDELHDIAINNDTSKIIWSIGDTDVIKYHGATNRGTQSIGLLAPPMNNDPASFKNWTMSVNMTIPAEETTYWCKISKSPTFTSPQQFVGFEAILSTPEAKTHSHHILVNLCIAPPGSSAEALFERFADQQGEKCYGATDAEPVNPDPLPQEYCRTLIFGWAVGGKPTFLPDHLGYPLEELQYYMIQIHYDNPERVENVSFETGLVMYYTDQKRDNEAGTLSLGHDTIYTLTIPPVSTDWMVVGQCSSECTRHLPSQGIKFFNVFLHSHLSGRKLKIRHFRNDIELPWLIRDDHYDFDYQQNRPLLDEVIVLPGDHLTLECSYDTTWKANNGSTIGGESTFEEMCNAVGWYYPKMNLTGCLSRVQNNVINDYFGIEELDWSEGGTDPLIAAPPSLAGNKYSKFLDTLNWTNELKNGLQEKIRFSQHDMLCITNNGMDATVKPSGYPNEQISPYVPEETCKANSGTNLMTSSTATFTAVIYYYMFKIF